MQSRLNMEQRQSAICCMFCFHPPRSFRLMNRLVPLEEMQARFGDESIWVYNILRGIDHSEGKSEALKYMADRE